MRRMATEGLNATRYLHMDDERFEIEPKPARVRPVFRLVCQLVSRQRLDLQHLIKEEGRWSSMPNSHY